MARRLGLDRVKERAVQQGLVTRNTGRMQRAAQKEIVRAMRQLGEAQANEESLTEVVREHRRRMRRIIESTQFDVATMFAKRLEDLIGKAMKNEARERRIREWLARVTGTVAAAVSQTTVDDVLQIITAALREGESVTTIADRIREVAPSIAARRAAKIARTEVHAAAQAGQLESARASGLRMEKEWVSSRDQRVRSGQWDHADADGERVPVDGTFMETGQPMDFPGDPAGAPGNVINCRCACVYHVVE